MLHLSEKCGEIGKDLGTVAGGIGDSVCLLDHTLWIDQVADPLRKVSEGVVAFAEYFVCGPDDLVLVTQKLKR